MMMIVYEDKFKLWKMLDFSNGLIWEPKIIPPHTVRGLRFSVVRACAYVRMWDSGWGDPDPNPYFSGFP
jgi:hypothetical protein